MEDGLATETRLRPPSVDRILTLVRMDGGPAVDSDVLAETARSVVAEERRRLAGGAEPTPAGVLAVAVRDRLAEAAAERPSRALNATGVIIHTNLGRAPWPEEAIAAAREAAGSLLLEIDAATGRRGRRLRLAEEHLVALTGADDALITNNNAAAVAL